MSTVKPTRRDTIVIAMTMAIYLSAIPAFASDYRVIGWVFICLAFCGLGVLIGTNVGAAGKGRDAGGGAGFIGGGGGGCGGGGDGGGC